MSDGQIVESGDVPLGHRPHFYVAKRFEQMVKVLKRRKKASFEKVKV